MITRKTLNAKQQSAEEYVNSISLIAKRVRMGEITAPVGSGVTNSISVLDNSDGNTYVYSFAGGNLKFGQNSATNTLAANVSGNFYVSNNSPRRLTITIKPSDATAADNRERIQTTVSTRSYNN